MSEAKKSALLEQIDQAGSELVELVLSYFQGIGQPVAGYSLTLHKPKFSPVKRLGGASLMIRGKLGQKTADGDCLSQAVLNMEEALKGVAER